MQSIPRQYLRKSAKYLIRKAFNKTCLAIRIYTNHNSFIFNTGIECFTMLHDSMDRFGKQIAVEEITGQDFIIYTPERRIGKTEAALYLAHEYNMPYLVKLAQLDFVKRQAKEAGYNIKFVPLSRPQIEGMRLRTILKDECIKTKEAREYIGKYINIIGIEEI